MSDATTISVVIPAYNRSHCIKSAVRSVLLQDFPIREIIVVDDGSKDDLEEALAPFKDRVRLVRHRTNMGAAAARNTGTQAASGKYIAFLDSDDTWKPEKLRRQIDFMQRRSLDVSCSGFETISSGEGSLARVAWRPYPETMHLQHDVWGCYTSPGSTLIADRARLNQCGGYDRGLSRYEDWDLMLRLSQSGRTGLGFLAEPLTVVSLGARPSKDQALAALERLIGQHHDKLLEKDRGLARRLRSAAAFNRAGIYAAHGDWPAMARELARSLLLAPVGNWPFRVILREKLSRRLSRLP